jgi:hypothetical protein
MTNWDCESFEVRIRVPKNTPEAVLLQYLSAKSKADKQSITLQAIRAFWLPVALKKLEKASEEEIQHCAYEQMLLMDNQRCHFISLFGLEDPRLHQIAMAVRLSSLASHHSIPSVEKLGD